MIPLAAELSVLMGAVSCGCPMSCKILRNFIPSLYRLQVEMGRRDSARGSPRERCFLLGPFRNDARMDAPLCREAFSPSLVRMWAGLPVSQLRFLHTSRLAGAWLAALAAALVAGWRALARPANMLALCPCRKR